MTYDPASRPQTEFQGQVDALLERWEITWAKERDAAASSPLHRTLRIDAPQSPEQAQGQRPARPPSSESKPEEVS